MPTRDIRYFLPAMKAHREEPKRWSAVGAREETRKLLRRIRKDGVVLQFGDTLFFQPR